MSSSERLESMEAVVTFSKPSRPADFLDLARFPKLEVRGELVFQHRGELYEEALAGRFASSVKAEIRAFDARGRFYATCEEGFLNLVFWMGTRWPPEAHSIVLLNAQNKTQDSQGNRVGGRFCDLWWFSEDRHVLYSVVPGKAFGQPSTWPPRNDDVYRGAPVGVARQPWALLHGVVRDVLPQALLEKLLRLRAGSKMTADEQRLLHFIEVPPRPPARTVSTPRRREVLPHYDVAAVEESLVDFSEDVDVVLAERGRTGLWHWAYCLNLVEPCLMRFALTEASEPYLDFTEQLLDLVRLRDMGLDPLADRVQLMESCMEVLLDCCPPSWRSAAKAGALVCSAAGMVLLTAKSWRLFLGAVPLPLRVSLDLRSPTGCDPACVWTMTGESSERRVWWMDERGLQEAAPRRFCVKNTRFARDVRDAFGLTTVQQLTWADLKMFETLEKSWAEARPDAGPPPASVKGTPARVEAPPPPPSVKAPPEQQPPAEVVKRLQEDIREANEAAHRERAQRRQTGRRKLQSHSKKERRFQPEEAPLVETTPPPKAAPKGVAIAKVVPIRENDDDLDELLAAPGGRKASDTFRAVGKLMKRALWKERRDEVRRRLCELVH
jgi:hypothetical protein